MKPEELKHMQVGGAVLRGGMDWHYVGKRHDVTACGIEGHWPSITGDVTKVTCPACKKYIDRPYKPAERVAF